MARECSELKAVPSISVFPDLPLTPRCDGRMFSVALEDSSHSGNKCNTKDAELRQEMRKKLKKKVHEAYPYLGRGHLFPVSGGDVQKRKILREYADRLAKADCVEKEMAKIRTEEGYTILATGQGFFTRLTRCPTQSVIVLEQMAATRRDLT